MIKLAAVFYATIAAGATSSPDDIYNYANKTTGIVLLVVIVYGAIKEWWVTGRQYKRIVTERDQLLDLLLKQQEITQKGLETAEKVIKK